MSTGSTPPGATPGATPPADEGTRLSLGAVIAIAVAVLAIAGVGGYLIGHNKGESSGDSAGYAEGLAAGKKQVQANYEEGKPGYEKIFAAGQAAGEKTGKEQGKRVGFEEGERQGVSTGQSEGVRQGAAAVLGGFDSWTDGAYYVITMEAGSDVPYTISSRTQVQPATSYHLCSSGGSQQLCQSPLSGGGDGSGGDDNGGDDNGGAQE